MRPFPPDRPPRAPRRARTARGFTLIEAAMVTVIVGVGVMSMLQLLAAGSAENGDAARMTTAMTLANNVREMSLALAFYDPQQNPAVAPRVWDSREATPDVYDNVMDLDGPVDTWDKPEQANGWQKFSPPRDGTRKTISGYTNWAQYVKVENVSRDDLTTRLPHDPDTEVVRVTAKITKDEVEVYRSSWLVFVPLTAKQN
jgi:Tfp pilus assembly protein PilV